MRPLIILIGLLIIFFCLFCVFGFACSSYEDYKFDNKVNNEVKFNGFIENEK
jgi:hypothetical protein